MPDDRSIFTTHPKTLVEVGQLNWGGEHEWSSEVAESTNVDIVDGGIRPRPPTTTLTWDGQAEWDAAQSRERVSTRAIGSRSPDDIRLGYDTAYGVLADHLVGYWPLDEQSGPQAVDYSPNENHGDHVSPQSLGNPAVLGTYSYEIDGASAPVELPVSDFSPQSFTDLSFAAWIYPRGISGTSGIIGRDTSSTANNFHWEIGSTGLRLRYNDHDHRDTPTPPLNQWSFWVTTFNRETNHSVHYLDAEPISTHTEDASHDLAFDTATTHWLGSSLNATQRAWNGYLSDVMWFSKTLTASDVQSLYETAFTGSLTTSVKEA